MTWGRIFRIGFIVLACVSLLVNAVIIGIGANLSKRGWFDREGGRAFMEVPKETRRAYLHDLKAARPDLNRLRDDLRAKRRIMLELAANDPIDPEEFAKALADVRAATAALQSAAHAVMVKTAERRASGE